MSVASKNPFALLDEDSSRPATPPPAQKVAAPQPPALTASRNQPKPKGPASRGGKYYPRGGKPSPSNDAPQGAEEPVADARKLEGARGARGGRTGRARGGNTGGKGRTFDRHSATGKTDSQKKVHQGWGGDEGNTELKTEQEGAADAAAEPATAEDSAPAEAVAASDGEAKPEGRPRRDREDEEEDNTVTFEQYVAQQKEKDAVVPKIEAIRQANEGAGDDLWKGAVALSKEEEDTYFVGKQKSAPKSKAKKEEKVFLEIDARFERPDRGGGRGRGRGGDRGGDRGGERRGRGAPRGGRPPQRQNGTPAPNVDDQKAFPSLS